MSSAQFVGDDRAAGQDGDILQHFLAAVAEAGGLDAQHVKVPRSLLRMRVDSASPSTSSAMMSSFLPLHHLLEQGRISWMLAIFLSVMRMSGSS